MKLNRIKKSLVAAAMGAGLLLSTAIGTPAHAAQTYIAKGSGYFPSVCPGKAVGGGSLKTAQGRATAATYTVYYSPINNGTNCIVVRDNIAGSRHMRADIWLSGQDGVNSAWNYGVLSTYAGPSAVKGTKGKCIGYYIRVEMPQGLVSQYVKSAHCGG